MPTGVVSWSQTAANNASADSTVNWAEGQAPSTVNDSARALMASVAKYRDDISGAVVTGGTSTAYTVASNQGFDSLVHLNGNMVAFTPHTTCGTTVTLNVDGLGAKPLRLAPTGLAGFPNVELQTGVLIQGTPYVAVYNNADSAFYLQSFFNAPYTVPIGGIIDYTGSTSPNSSFVLPYGQAISRATYSTYFAMVSTTFGVGDGSTTFNIPDLRGRVVAGKDDMGGSAASRLTSSTITGGATTLGNVGGAETITLTASQLPSLSITGSTSGTMSVSGTTPDGFNGGNVGSGVGGGGAFGGTKTGSVSGTASGSLSVSGSVSGTAGASHGNVGPTMVLNKLLRII